MLSSPAVAAILSSIVAPSNCAMATEANEAKHAKAIVLIFITV
jgi:hypothetical protein